MLELQHDHAGGHCDLPSCGSEKIFEYYNDRVCTVKLKYKISVPVIGLEREGVVNGYAR